MIDIKKEYPIFAVKTDKSPSENNWQKSRNTLSRLSGEGKQYGIVIPRNVIVLDLDPSETKPLFDLQTEIETVLNNGFDLPWDDAFLQSTPRGGAHFGFLLPEGTGTLKQGTNLFSILGFDSRTSGRGYVATGSGYVNADDAEVVSKLCEHPDKLPLLSVNAIRQLRSTSPGAGEADDLEIAVHNTKLGLSPKEAWAILDALPTSYNDSYDLWFKSGMAIVHEFGLTSTALKLFDRFSRKNPDKYPGKAEIKEKMRTFDSDDIIQFTFRSLIKATQEVGGHADLVDEFDDVSDIDIDDVGPSDALAMLNAMCSNSQVDKMEAQMLDDKFVMKGIAILGQWTVFYAAPNTGKTLLSLFLLKEAIDSGEIDGQDVYYANCDDTFNGSVQKLKIANEVGFNMLIPGQGAGKNQFNPNDLLKLIVQLTKAEAASGKVIVLDTLKKFTDLMDKKTSSQFGTIVRNFVTAGGTVIALAHVNKHKGSDGKSIYTGTADIRDDADCVFTIEQVAENETEAGIETSICFENTKLRGPVDHESSFTFISPTSKSYDKLFASVTRVGKSAVIEAKNKSERNEALAVDRPNIKIVRDYLDARRAPVNQGELASLVAKEGSIGVNKARKLLARWSGDEATGGLWVASKDTFKNATFYQLHEHCGIDVGDDFDEE